MLSICRSSSAARTPGARALRHTPQTGFFGFRHSCRHAEQKTCPQGTCTGFSNTSRHTGHVKRLRGSVSDAGFADCAAPSRDSGCAAAILPLRSVALREKAPPRGAGPPSFAHARRAEVGGAHNPPGLLKATSRQVCRWQPRVEDPATLCPRLSPTGTQTMSVYRYYS